MHVRLYREEFCVIVESSGQSAWHAMQLRPFHNAVVGEKDNEKKQACATAMADCLADALQAAGSKSGQGRQIL